MKVNAQIASFSVFSSHISISMIVLCDRTSPFIQEIRGMDRDNGRSIEIGNLKFTGVVNSISLSKGIRILLHAERSKYILNRLFELSGYDTVSLRIKTDREARIERMLSIVSEKENAQPSEILYRLTTFTGKDGKLIEGKRCVDEISRKCQDVVISKLSKIIRGDAHGIGP